MAPGIPDVPVTPVTIRRPGGAAREVPQPVSEEDETVEVRLSETMKRIRRQLPPQD